jgi:hypothetical protein
MAQAWQYVVEYFVLYPKSQAEHIYVFRVTDVPYAGLHLGGALKGSSPPYETSITCTLRTLLFEGIKFSELPI